MGLLLLGAKAGRPKGRTVGVDPSFGNDRPPGPQTLSIPPEGPITPRKTARYAEPTALHGAKTAFSRYALAGARPAELGIARSKVSGLEEKDLRSDETRRRRRQRRHLAGVGEAGKRVEVEAPRTDGRVEDVPVDTVALAQQHDGTTERLQTLRDRPRRQRRLRGARLPASPGDADEAGV